MIIVEIVFKIKNNFLLGILSQVKPDVEFFWEIGDWDVNNRFHVEIVSNIVKNIDLMIPQTCKKLSLTFIYFVLGINFSFSQGLQIIPLSSTKIPFK